MSLPRYSEYKDSGVEWLGEVPGHWKMRSLRYAATIQNGADFKDCEVTEGGFPVLGSGGEFARISKFIYDQPSVLLGRKGTIDNPLYIEEPFWTVDTLFYTKIAADTYPKFFYWFCTSIPFDYFQFGSAVPSMTQNDLYGIKVPTPSIGEQQTIATFLDHETGKIDALIAEQQRLVELLAEKRQAVISHAVTKGLNPKAKMKDSGIEWLGEVPKHWEVKRLKFLCDVQTGDKDTVNAIDDGEYPFFVRSQTVERINSFTFDCEAVLTAGDGVGVGKVYHYVNGKFDFHQRVYMMNNFRFVTGKFFFQYLAATFHKVALGGGAKSTVDSLRMPLFMNFEITVPSIDEQSEIIVFLDTETVKFDTLTAEANRAIALLQERRSALISAAVTGKIDVRQAA